MLFVLLLFISCFQFVVSAQDATPVINRSTTIQVVDGKEYFFHAVQRGQTLFSISRAYGVTEEDIRRANPEVREQGLKYDQLIKIPVIQQTQAQKGVFSQSVIQTTYESHQVKRRETLYGISRMYNLSMEEVLEHNPEARTGLRPNMMLRIPRQTIVQVNYTEYLVPPGQTLFSVSREYNVSIEELERLNPELKDGLKAGQVLKLPTDALPAQPPFVHEERVAEPLTPVLTKEADPYCANPQLKRQYNVALLIPFFLERMNDETPNLSDPRHPSFTFMEYYQGMLIAVDSIRARGVDLRLNVFDVCDSPTKLRTVLRKPEMANMDLIIGPFYPVTLEIAAEFAKARNIPIVSPLHWEDNKLLERFDNLFQATPSIQNQMNDMALYVAHNHADDNIILVHNNQAGVINLIAGYKKTLNAELNYRQYHRDSINLAKIDGYYLNGGVYVGERLTNVYVINDSLLPSQSGGRNGVYQEARERYMSKENIREMVYARDGMNTLKAMLDTNRRNVLVTLMGGEALIPDYNRQLNQLRDAFNITVYGVPQWRDYRSMDFSTMQNLRVHLFTTDFIDYSKPQNVAFIRRFRAENNAEPGAVAFRAVNTGMYFFSALSQYGAEFWRCVNQINEKEALSVPLWFEKASGENSGWENRFVYIFRYENYQLKNVKEPTSNR